MHKGGGEQNSGTKMADDEEHTGWDAQARELEDEQREGTC